MPLANLKVDNIVARSDFQGPGAELRFNGRIADDGNGPLHYGQDNLLTHRGGIAGILGMHRHAGIAQHRLRAGRGHGDISRPVGPGIAQIVEPAGLFLIFHFQVGQGGGAAGTPVDNALVAVNQPLAV